MIIIKRKYTEPLKEGGLTYRTEYKVFANDDIVGVQKYLDVEQDKTKQFEFKKI